MEVKHFLGKDYDETLKSALEKLNLTEDDVLVKVVEKKGNLFSNNQVDLIIVPLSDILNYIEDYIVSTFKKCDTEIMIESSIKNKQIIIKLHSSKSPLLIGKMGHTLDAIQRVVKQSVKTQFYVSPYISVDVENYKDRQLLYLKKTAIRIAKEVEKTKIAVELDNMNSYERLIVHNEIKNVKGVYTESIGEEPNRHIVIKPKE